jgi:hypothetical protein
MHEYLRLAPIFEPIMSPLLEIALASFKLSSGTLKGFLPLALPWEPGSLGLEGKVQKKLICGTRP